MPAIQQHLTDNLGLQPHIAQFFSGRKLPEGNEYWLKQPTYMSTAPGYVFIPVYFDLLTRQNISVDVLLSEDLLVTMELILHSAGKLEREKISQDQHISECRDILKSAGVSDVQIENVELDLVNRAFIRIPPRYRSLRRANTFLYTFARIGYDPSLLFASWEQTVPVLLMLDDFADIGEDMKASEENCLLDGGPVAENFFELASLVDGMMTDLAGINPVLSGYLRNLKNEAVARSMFSVLVKGNSSK